MTIHQLPVILQDEALKIAELGMSYQYVTTTFGNFIDAKGLLVCGRYFMPVDLAKLTVGDDYRDDRRVFLDASVAPAPVAFEGNVRVAIRVNNLPSQGVFRAGTATSTPPFQTKTAVGDIFYRLSPYRDDRRISKANGLVPGTYSTTNSDIEIVPSGLAAVGRYALPSRLPAIHVFRITPTPGTPVSYGTVVPNYGLCGGGVEAYFPQGTDPGSVYYCKQISMK